MAELEQHISTIDQAGSLIGFIQPVLQNIDGGEILLYLSTLFGAAVAHMFSLNKGFEGTKPFLKNVFAARHSEFYARVDFILVSLIGSIIGTIIFAPKEHFQALTAGMCWVGAVNIIMKSKSDLAEGRVISSQEGQKVTDATTSGQDE